MLNGFQNIFGKSSSRKFLSKIFAVLCTILVTNWVTMIIIWNIMSNLNVTVLFRWPHYVKILVTTNLIDTHSYSYQSMSVIRRYTRKKVYLRFTYRFAVNPSLIDTHIRKINSRGATSYVLEPSEKNCTGKCIHVSRSRERQSDCCVMTLYASLVYWN